MMTMEKLTLPNLFVITQATFPRTVNDTWLFFFQNAVAN